MWRARTAAAWPLSSSGAQYQRWLAGGVGSSASGAVAAGRPQRDVASRLRAYGGSAERSHRVIGAVLPEAWLARVLVFDPMRNDPSWRGLKTTNTHADQDARIGDTTHSLLRPAVGARGPGERVDCVEVPASELID
jgi:hypothetical protein